MTTTEYDFEVWCARAEANNPDTVGMLAQMLLELAHEVASDGFTDDIQRRLTHLMPRSRAVIEDGLSHGHRVLAEIVAIRSLAGTALAMSGVSGESVSRWVRSMQASYAHQADVLSAEALVVATNAAFHELVTLARG